MSIDREQIRRDAEEVVTHGSFVHEDLPSIVARHCLALLAELEQAERERERDERERAAVMEGERRIAALEASLAKVPALVEALREIRDEIGDGGPVPPPLRRCRSRANYALIDWEQT